MSGTPEVSAKGNQRMSNFELLRLLCMLGIVISHMTSYIRWGGNVGIYIWYLEPSVFTNILRFIRPLGKLSVICFFLLTGYFMTYSMNIRKNVSKLLTLWLQIVFFALVIWSVYYLIDGSMFDPDYIHPITSNLWWFASSYFGVMLVAPFINRLVNRATRAQYMAAVVVSVVIWLAIPTFTDFRMDFYNILACSTLYLIGGYLRRYPVRNTRVMLSVCLTILIASYVSIFAVWLLTDSEHLPLGILIGMIDESSLVLLLCAVALFLLFSRLDIGCRSHLNSIAAGVFSVYLIHCHPLVEGTLKNIFSSFSIMNVPHLISLIQVGGMLIFLVCLMAGVVYDRLIGRLVAKNVNRIVMGWD